MNAHNFLSYADTLFTPSESFIVRGYRAFDALTPVYAGHDVRGPGPAGAHVLAGGILCGDVPWRCPACLGQRAIHGARVLGAPLVCRCVRFCKRIAIEQRRCVDAVRTAPALVRAACVPLRSLSVWPYAQGGRPAGGLIRTDRALTLTRPLRSQRTRLLRIATVKSARPALAHAHHRCRIALSMAI